MLIPQINNSARADKGAIARWWQDTNGSLTSAGTGNDYTLATNNANLLLADQSVLIFRADRANTGAATLKVNALDAKDLVKNGDAPLTAGNIKQDQLVIAVWNATSDNYEMLNPAGGTDNDIIRASQFISTTSGSNFLAGAGTNFRLDMSENNAGNTIIFDIGRFTVAADIRFRVLQPNSGNAALEISTNGSDGQVFGSSLASQSEAEAGSRNDKLMTPFRTAQAISEQAGEGAKGWVSFSSSGNIQDSFNVSDVDRTSSGTYSISWATNFANSNYAVVATTDGSNIVQIVSKGVGAATVRARDDVGNINDAAFNVIAFGAQ